MKNSCVIVLVLLGLAQTAMLWPLEDFLVAEGNPETIPVNPKRSVPSSYWKFLHVSGSFWWVTHTGRIPHRSWPKLQRSLSIPKDPFNFMVHSSIVQGWAIDFETLLHFETLCIPNADRSFRIFLDVLLPFWALNLCCIFGIFYDFFFRDSEDLLGFLSEFSGIPFRHVTCKTRLNMGIFDILKDSLPGERLLPTGQFSTSRSLSEIKCWILKSWEGILWDSYASSASSVPSLLIAIRLTLSYQLPFKWLMSNLIEISWFPSGGNQFGSLRAFGAHDQSARGCQRSSRRCGERRVKGRSPPGRPQGVRCSSCQGQQRQENQAPEASGPSAQGGCSQRPETPRKETPSEESIGKTSAFGSHQ